MKLKSKAKGAAYSEDTCAASRCNEASTLIVVTAGERVPYCDRHNEARCELVESACRAEELVEVDELERFAAERMYR